MLKDWAVRCPTIRKAPELLRQSQAEILPPGYEAYVDDLMTSTVAVVYDPDAFAWVQGPTGTAQYKDAHIWLTAISPLTTTKRNYSKAVRQEN